MFRFVSRSFLGVFVLCILSSSVHSSDADSNTREFNLDTYLRRVRIQNEGFRSSQLQKLGSTQSQAQADLLTSPTLYGSATAFSDSRLSVFAALQGALTQGVNLNSGVRWMTDEGWNFKAEYRWNLNYLPGAGRFGDFQIPTTYVDSGPLIQATLPLLRNAGGIETRAIKQNINEGVNFTQAYESFKMKQILEAAEHAYWDFAYRQENLKIAEKSKEKSQELYNWVSRRQGMGLTDVSDLYQAKASLKQHDLTLQEAKSALKTAERNMASYLGPARLEPNIKTYSLQNYFEYMWKKIPQDFKPREDLLAAEAQTKQLNAQLELEKQKRLANLDLTFSAALNQWDTQLGSSFSNIASIRNPYFAVTATFSLPYEGDKNDKVVEGFATQIEAAQLRLAQQKFDSETKVTDLKARIADLKEKLDLTEELEKIHLDKLNAEISKHRNGRSTLYQVIAFELDHQMAQSSKSKIQLDLLHLITELRSYQK
jgi:hypothetical protein